MGTLLRYFVWAFIAAFLAAGIYYLNQFLLKREYEHIIQDKWTLDDVETFLRSLPQSDLREFGNLVARDNASAEELTKHLIWLSSSTFTYPFKDKNNVDYHKDILSWVAEENGVGVSGSYSSFYLERSVLESKFAQIWETLTPEQRTELLKNHVFDGLSDSEKKALVAGTGAAAIGVLSATVAFSGFAFYTAMSSVMAASAGLLGVTLPFSVYTGASSTVAALSGPVGWGIALIAGTGAAIWAAAPNPEKTAAFILALHTYKAKRAYEIARRLNLESMTDAGQA